MSTTNLNNKTNLLDMVVIDIKKSKSPKLQESYNIFMLLPYRQEYF